MKFILIPDKFKGSATAEEVIAAIKAGLLKAFTQPEIIEVIASDGGDGFLDAVAYYKKLNRVWVTTVDPLGRPMQAVFLEDQEEQTAYIELAAASGMVLLKQEERNPLVTSTYGTGMQIKEAISRGAKKIYVGLGGSATNDGGAGMAEALGFSFYNDKGEKIKINGEQLSDIAQIKPPEDFAFSGVQFYAVNDVNNPLYGLNGAAHVYAAQKGATEKDIAFLDEGLRHLDRIVQREFGVEIGTTAGAGAAGGAAFGLKAFAEAEFISGIDFILQLSGVLDAVKAGDINYIITGEGKIDEQTLHGKLIDGVLRLGVKHSIPVIAVCGKLAIEEQFLKEKGIAAVLETMDTSKDLDYNMKHGTALIEQRIFQYFSSDK